MMRKERVEMRMVRWMCGRQPTTGRIRRVGVEATGDVMRRSKLGLYGQGGGNNKGVG